MAEKRATSVSLIVAVNDEEVFRDNLLASASGQSDVEILPLRGFRSAGTAYSSGRAKARNDILIFAHQDVYFPPGWFSRFADTVVDLESRDPNWGVLGVFGISTSREPKGHVYSSGLMGILGGAFQRPIEASTLDELILIVRRSSVLEFDRRLPGFHLYGADICLQATHQEMKNYIIPAFCIHNSNGLRKLPLAFWRSYLYMQRKWWNQLPVTTPCIQITRTGFPFLSSMRTAASRALRREKVGKRQKEPATLYEDFRARINAELP
jgi:hypothetical protein